MSTKKERIRDELEKLATQGYVTYYGVLAKRAGVSLGHHEWKPILDQISRAGKVAYDITFLVLNANKGWPGQVGFKTMKGTSQQKHMAQQELDRVFKACCPRKNAPTLPVPKRWANRYPDTVLS